MYYSFSLLGQFGLLGATLAAPSGLFPAPGHPNNGPGPHGPPPHPQPPSHPGPPVLPPIFPFPEPPSPPQPKSTLPARYPPLPGPEHPKPLDHSVKAALEALGRSSESFRGPGTVPFPHLKEGTDSIPGIKHFVFLMMENHSFDNMMGVLKRPDVDGFEFDHNGVPKGTQPGANGTTQHWFETPFPCQNEDMVSQEWTTSHNAFNNGSLNGGVVNPIDHTKTGASGPFSMSYFTPRVMPAWFALMEQVTIADRWFCSALAQTWPTRMFSLAGTSRGVTATGQNEDGIFWPEKTIFNKLDEFGISWKVAWNSTANTTGNTTAIFNGTISNESMKEHIFDYETFYKDCATGDLPSFYYLDQRGSATTQEPAKNMALGENLIYNIVKALMTGPKWKETLFLINYDEHGGFADHVPPPPAIAPDEVEPIVKPGEFQYEGFGRLGFRVPAAIISPYGKKNFVSHTVYDHTSMLAFMERKWNLPAMTYRDANANSIEDMIDFEAMAKGKMTFPSWEALKIPLPLLQIPGNDALNCTNTPLQPPPGSVTKP
ncbi:phosphoesterase family-domain-containing protein [Xylogone sp. PMI_703]|nr:phosphoesterase family-domain-containing protein [Xylogone sp. PMI_703]